MFKVTLRASVAGLLAWVMVAACASAADEPGPPVPGQLPAARPAGDLPGPIDHMGDLVDTGKLLFRFLDSSRDLLISKREAIDAGNLIVGGFFFRADTNGDGMLSPEEARQARKAFLDQQPLLRAILQAARPGKPQTGTASSEGSPAMSLGWLLDEDSDRQLQAKEVRAVVVAVVECFYDTADTNHDGQLSPAEADRAMVAMGRGMLKNMFLASDTDQNGSLSLAELDHAIKEPIHVLFRTMDTDHDGQITPQEAQRTSQALSGYFHHLRLIEPPAAPGRATAPAPGASSSVAPRPVVPAPVQ
jgi:hypothetical protein